MTGTSFTIALGIGLTDGVLGPEPRHLSSASHVGRGESERLMGAGREYGRGPLPNFLAQIDRGRRSGRPIGLVLLCDIADSDGRAEPIAAPLAHLAAGAEVVYAPPTELPWEPLLAAIRRASGIDPLAAESRDQLRFLVFGCETEHRVLAASVFLRSMLGHARVATSPHLVGSATSEAHLAALRHHLPRAGVQVLVRLRDAAAFGGLDDGAIGEVECDACAIEPGDVREALGETHKRIVQLLCLHWTKAQLRPLSGGFSGSLLLLASGWKGHSRTEPMVIKVDQYRQMRREIDGYHQVKDFLGKHVPTFEYPVVVGETLGVGMDLAAMEGAPKSLQDSFEEAESEEALTRFLRRLDKTLELLASRLYRNTCRTEWVSPYRAFHLHTAMQQEWLAENIEAIDHHWTDDTGTPLAADRELLGTLLRMLARNDDGLESEVCVVHGDLNLKNIICDEGENVWLIDWTHCARMPIELDFAKLESDVKIVLSKEFDLEDLPRLRSMEEYLLAHRLPAAIEHLPDSLRFVRWDLRFRKILLAVSRIRQVCFALKEGDNWLVYRAALLKYALHSLSFDKRRGRGECDLPQLMLALHSVETLLHDLVVDDFQLKIRGERHPSYPPRQRVSIDVAPWAVECPDYDPPYYVAPDVLANDRTRVSGGWADPEDATSIASELAERSALRDACGRPLHPFGRTGLAGRGVLGRWGPNVSVIVVVTRTRPESDAVDILLGAPSKSDTLLPPSGFAGADEDVGCAAIRLLEADTGWRPSSTGNALAVGYDYDPRRTDHAWVVTSVRHIHLAGEEGPKLFRVGASFESVAWYPLDASTINRIPAVAARHVREVVRVLERAGDLAHDAARTVLAATG